MTPHFLTRRGFLGASAALGAMSLIPATARAASPLGLTAASRVLDVDGRAATVYGIANSLGGQGLVLNPGEPFQLSVTNGLDVETILHWHGQIPPNVQDGVPGNPMPALLPGEVRDYDFTARPGTHWMHSHIPVQEMQLLAAPLIVRRPEEVAEDRQEVVMFLHDFSFTPPEEILAGLTGGMGGMNHATHGMAGSDGGTGMMGMDMSGMDMSGMDMSGMGGMAMDLNDIAFDAYLANDRTLNDPDVISVEAGGRVRLRVINAAAATVFWIDTGAVDAQLVAVDGEPVQPITGRRFGMAMAQRIDLLINLPAGEGAFPILALREGAQERAGIILATAGAAIGKLPVLGEEVAPALDLALESQLVALSPLPARPVDQAPMVMLSGSMMPYQWAISGPVTARTGERVEIMFHNMSMMGHPMHLHGHAFQVVNLGGRVFAGAVRDTVYLPPMSMVTVAVDAGEAANWMLHCHHMAHLASGMMTEFQVSA